MMMAMTIIAKYVAMLQQARHGKLIKRNVQQMDVTVHTMPVHYASVTITN